MEKFCPKRQGKHSASQSKRKGKDRKKGKNGEKCEKGGNLGEHLEKQEKSAKILKNKTGEKSTLNFKYRGKKLIAG